MGIRIRIKPVLNLFGERAGYLAAENRLTWRTPFSNRAQQTSVGYDSRVDYKRLRAVHINGQNCNGQSCKGQNCTSEDAVALQSLQHTRIQSDSLGENAWKIAIRNFECSKSREAHKFVANGV